MNEASGRGGDTLAVLDTRQFSVCVPPVGELVSKTCRERRDEGEGGRRGVTETRNERGWMKKCMRMCGRRSKAVSVVYRHGDLVSSHQRSPPIDAMWSKVERGERTAVCPSCDSSWTRN